MRNNIQKCILVSMLAGSCRPTLYTKPDTLTGSEAPSIGIEDSYMPHPVLVYAHKETPVFYDRADKSCSKAGALPQMGSINLVSEVSNNKPGSITRNLGGTTGSGLRNQYIRGVYVNFHIRVTYDECTKVESITYQCKKAKRQIINPGELIQLCKPGGYPRDSLENAALNLAVHTTTILKNSRDGFSPLEIMVHPKQEIVINTKSGPISFFEVNNAYWTSMARNEKSYSKGVYFLPHSESFLKMFSNFTYFWEQPGVVGHEVVHHIFYETVNGSEKKLAAREDGLFENFESIEENINYFVSSSGVRVVSSKEVLSAINEGIADALSRLINMKQSSDISFGKMRITNHQISARDIFSPTNDDGALKKLGIEELRRFLKASISRPVDPKTPNQQDVHTIGAIAARGLTELVELKHEATEPSTAVVDELIETFTTWTQKLEPYAKAKPVEGAQAKDFLQKILLEGVMLTSKGGTFTKDQCKGIKEFFPVYYIDWQNQLKCQ